MVKRIIFWVVVVVLLGTFTGCSAPTNVQTTVRLARVIDGDTFVTERGEVIRLAGVDTPEREEPDYLRATIELRGELLRQDIILDRRGVGKYGRTIACVYVGKKSIDEHMIRAGYRRWQGTNCYE
jgi:micrococcal nuclease